MKILLTIMFLFSRLSLPAPVGAPPPDEYVVRERWASIEPLALDNDAAGLNFFNDAQFVCVFTDVTNDTWYGYLYGVQYGYCYVSRSGDVYHVHVGSPLGIYEARYWDGLYRLQELEFGGID